MMDNRGLLPEDIGREDAARALERDAKLRRLERHDKARRESRRRKHGQAPAWGYRVPGKRMKRELGE